MVLLLLGLYLLGVATGIVLTCIMQVERVNKYRELEQKRNQKND